MEERHGGHLLAAILERHGVDTIFTLSSGHLAPLYDACASAGIRIVDFRHEHSGVFAADGWARVTGRPGVAAVTAGPGVTNAVTGLANANAADSPVLVIGGKSPRAQQGTGAFQEMDHLRLVRSVTRWAETCWESGRIAGSVLDAFRHLSGGRPGPAFFDIPVDVLLEAWPEGDEAPEARPLEARVQGDPELVARAARLLSSAERPVVLAGSGVRWAGADEALEALADALKAPVFLSSLGRGCLPPGHRSFFAAARKHALGAADVVLALGVEWDYRLGFGRSVLAEDARVIQVDVDGRSLGRNRAVEIGIAGDPGLVMAQLIEAGAGNVAEPAWTGEVRDEEFRLHEEARAGMESDAVPVHPQRLAREIRDFLDEDSVVVGDGGDVVGIAASILPARGPGRWLDPGPFGCLGVGPAFAMAARLAHPRAQVLVVYGDGSFGLSAMEFDSAIRQDLPFVGVIGNDGAWGQTKVAQEELYGSAPAAFLSQETGYEKVVEALGGYGERVTEPGEIRPALERASASGVAACVNVMVDPTLMHRASYLG